MSTHAPAIRQGIWTPRLVVAEAIYGSSRGLHEYLVYRNLTDADRVPAGGLGCTCIGFRTKQLRGEPASCKHTEHGAGAAERAETLARVASWQDRTASRGH